MVRHPCSISFNLIESYYFIFTIIITKTSFYDHIIYTKNTIFRFIIEMIYFKLSYIEKKIVKA